MPSASHSGSLRWKSASSRACSGHTAIAGGRLGSPSRSVAARAGAEEAVFGRLDEMRMARRESAERTARNIRPRRPRGRRTKRCSLSPPNCRSCSTSRSCGSFQAVLTPPCPSGPGTPMAVVAAPALGAIQARRSMTLLDIRRRLDDGVLDLARERPQQMLLDRAGAAVAEPQPHLAAAISTTSRRRP